MSKCLVAAVVMAVLMAGVAMAEEQAAAPAALQSVESSLIKEVGYDAVSQVLTVVFVTEEGTYEYQKVPEEMYKELMAAESKGSYFAKNIKGKFEFVKK